MTNDFDFDLPAELIAQEPPRRRGDARCLLVVPGRGIVAERIFRDLPALLRRGDRLVLNDSRVLPARLWTRRTDTGGQVEILLLRPVGDRRTWACFARPARRLRAGVRLAVVGPADSDQAVRDPAGEFPAGENGPELRVEGRGADGEIVIGADTDLADLAEAWGVMPLPPYIRRPRGGPDNQRDRDRYQTVYARPDGTGAGSVAAPTAGLHFSATTLAALAAAGIDVSRVSLHVGPGTFQPPTGAQLAARRLHGEHFHLSAAAAAELAATRAAGGRIIAVGTTALRVLETVARLELPAAGGPDVRDFVSPDPEPAADLFTGRASRQDGHWDVAGETRLFVAPPDRVTAADGLLTNFHLPGSSLVMLVAALLGETATGPLWRRVYQDAVTRQMRFYSYGDCMLVLPGSDLSPDEGRP